MSSLKYWVWLSSLRGVGAVTAAALLRRFGTPENVFLASAEDYKEVDGLKASDISQLLRKDIESAGKTIAMCAEIGCRVITLQDAIYPDRLRNIYDSPIILYVKGELPMIDDEPAVAIVGTRDCTPYGLKAAENISFQLARRGLLVVTGLARGVDSAAARGALRGGGRVVGVIGSGLDVVYPPENKALFGDVVKNGAIVSEYPPGAAAKPFHFPARNRILSGISLGVAVVEAPKKSGALITAARALEQGRDVFALPGNVDAKSCEGSNLLLREGAIPIMSGEDIAVEYAELFPDKINPENQKQAAPHDRKSTGLFVKTQYTNANDSPDIGKIEIDNASEVEYIDLDEVLSELTGDEKAVAQTIGRNSMHVDDIIVNSGLPAPQVLTALTMLEIKGSVGRVNSMYKIQCTF